MWSQFFKTLLLLGGALTLTRDCFFFCASYKNKGILYKIIHILCRYQRLVFPSLLRSLVTVIRHISFLPPYCRPPALRLLFIWSLCSLQMGCRADSFIALRQKKRQKIRKIWIKYGRSNQREHKGTVKRESKFNLCQVHHSTFTTPTG